VQSIADWRGNASWPEEESFGRLVRVRECEDLYSGALPQETLLHEDRSPVPQAQEGSSSGPGVKAIKPRKSWLRRLFSSDALEPDALEPDPPRLRKALRESLPGLAAYFWTGSAPRPHGVRDISETGIYVFTDERWYLGTVIRMTLTDREEPTVEHAITVHARVVRWGNDGVGLQFVLRGVANPDAEEIPLENGADKTQLDQFLGRVRRGNA
jgi:hypothetical protein